MKNIFKLTEGDLTKIVKRVIKESIDTEKFLSKVSSVISFPYIDTLESFGIPKEDWEKVFSMKYGEDIKIVYGKGNMVYVRSKKSDLLLYVEGDSPYYGDGYWEEIKYNDDNNQTYHENSNGFWEKSEYDDNGNNTYYENSDGDWYKQEYDEDGNEIYYEDSSGYVSTTDSDGYRRNNNLNESIDDKYYDKIVSILEPPYYQNLESMGIPKNQWERIFFMIFNQIVYINSEYIMNNNGDEIYYEDSDGYWYKFELDENGNEIYHEDSKGYWCKTDYDENDNRIYYENSEGYWKKYEYNENGNEIYFEDSDGVIIDKRNNGNLNESTESTEDIYYDKLLSILQPPYFKNLESIGIPEDLWESILSKVYNQNVYINSEYVNNNNGDEIYYEDSDGFWSKSEYDDNGNVVYYENSNGDWYIKEFNKNGKLIYREDSNGYVFDRRNNNLNESVDDKYYDKIVSILEPPYFQNLESIGIDVDYWKDIFNKLYGERVYIDFNGNIRNKKGKVIYYEQSDGYWRKEEYDNNGNVIHYENSNGYWIKQEYDEKGKLIYIENPDGEILNLR